MTICKVWKAGSDVYAVTIPKKFRDYYGIHIGDYIEVDLKPIPQKEVKAICNDKEIKVTEKPIIRIR